MIGRVMSDKTNRLMGRDEMMTGYDVMRSDMTNMTGRAAIGAGKAGCGSMRFDSTNET